LVVAKALVGAFDSGLAYRVIDGRIGAQAPRFRVVDWVQWMRKPLQKHAFALDRWATDDAGSLGLPLLRQPLRLGDLRGRHFGSHFIAKFDCLESDGARERRG
jgi:hypothetical protein